MPIATADQIRNRPILVTIPGTDQQIQCRRPDPLTLLADGVLPLPIFADVLEQLHDLMQPQPEYDNRPITDHVAKQPKTYEAFVARWVCAAAVAPRVVLTEEEAIADPEALWVEDLELDVQISIVRQTGRLLASARVIAAVRDFRRQQSAGAGAGSDRETVREDAVGAVAGA